MSDSLYPPETFFARARTLQDSYLESDDPILQSGFGGGAERWREEREPILEAVDGAGTFVDVGCANGYLVECLIAWARERGVVLTPHGVDIGERLVAKAKERKPQFASNFEVANGWDWRPKHRFRYVYTLSDCVPADMLRPCVERLMERAVEAGGRLILGSYGSRSRGIAAAPVPELLSLFGYEVAGSATGGDPPVTAFAWTDRS